MRISVITIRPRTVEDLPSCVAALRKGYEAGAYPAVWPEDPARWLSPAKLVDARVAEADRTVIGQVGIRESTLPEPVYAAIDNVALISVTRLFVVPCRRRDGVGRRLIDAAVELAEQHGRRAVLDVEDGGLPRFRCMSGPAGGESTAARGLDDARRPKRVPALLPGTVTCSAVWE